MTEHEVKQKWALSLYAADKVTLIPAANIASVGFFKFQGLFRDRKNPQHYGLQDLEEDLRSFQRKTV